MEGWLLLHRKLGDSALWLEEPFTRGQAWVDLLMLAQHSPSHIRVQGMKINLKRGDVGESEVTLSLRWKWSRGKVRRFLEEIEKDGMVKKETSKMADRRKSVITICNYDSYQVFKKENGTGDGTSDGTGDGQATGRRRAGDGTGSTNDNECTNGKEVKAFCAEPQKDEVQAPAKSECSDSIGIGDEKPQEEKSKPRTKASLDLEVLPQVLRRDVILAFVESRKALRKPLTQRALLMCCKDAMRCQELHGIDPNDAMERAIGKGWMTCDPEYFSSQKKPGKPSTGSDKHGGFSEKDYGTGGLI